MYVSEHAEGKGRNGETDRGDADRPPGRSGPRASTFLCREVGAIECWLAHPVRAAEPLEDITWAIRRRVEGPHSHLARQ